MTKSALFSVRKNEPCPQCGAELVIRSGKTWPVSRLFALSGL